MSSDSPDILPFNIGLKAESAIVDPEGRPVSSMTWDKFAEWRKTKCRPFDYENGPPLALNPPAYGETPSPEYVRAMEEIGQSILEFIGEVAEIGELFAEHGPLAFYGNLRDKLIDECGDVFFCGCWALDAFGGSALTDSESLELVLPEEVQPFVMLGRAIRDLDPSVILGNDSFLVQLQQAVNQAMMTAHMNAGLLANSFKKLRYQRRAQDFSKQTHRIVTAMVSVAALLVLAGSSVSEALASNQKKLNARFPDGYKPGVGGGLRIGDGK